MKWRIIRAKPTKTESAMIAQAINDDTSQNEIAQKVLTTLEKCNDLISKFLKRTDGVSSKKRYAEIKKYLERLSTNLRRNVNNDIDVDSYLSNELSQLEKIYSSALPKENLNIPSLERIKTASTFTPYSDTKTFDSFLKNIEGQFFDVWDSAVRTGYMNGLTTNEIVKNVMGIPAKNAQVAKSGTIDVLRNSLMANTRTALQSFAIETRNELYRENANLFSGYKWMATLDRRTCLVCGSYDGKIFKSLDEIKNMPPFHLNCRCLIVPVVKGEEVSDMRAAENGPVDSKVTYEEWLKEQTKDVQKKILGAKRFGEFQNGQSINSFVSNGTIINVTRKE